MGCGVVVWGSGGGGDDDDDDDDGGGYGGDFEDWMREERGIVVCEGALMEREMRFVGV